MLSSSKAWLSAVIVLNTRDSSQNSVLSQLIKSNGAEVIEFPLLKISKSFCTEAIKNLKLESDDWLILTSANAAYIFSEFSELRNYKIAAVGASTAREVRKHGAEVNFISREPSAACLAYGFIENIRSRGLKFPKNVIYFLGSKAKSNLQNVLKDHNINTQEVVVYNSQRPNPNEAEIKEFVRFFSPSVCKKKYIMITSEYALENLLYFADKHESAKNIFLTSLIVVGINTETKARELGFKYVYRSSSANIKSMLDKILELEKVLL